jgi:hypothetical protein
MLCKNLSCKICLLKHTRRSEGNMFMCHFEAYWWVLSRLGYTKWIHVRFNIDTDLLWKTHTGDNNDVQIT